MLNLTIMCQGGDALYCKLYGTILFANQTYICQKGDDLYCKLYDKCWVDGPYFWCFCVFTCIFLELQVRTGSNLETRYVQIPSTITIIPKKISLHMRSAIIIGCNGRVVLEGYFEMVFSTDLTHFLNPRSTIYHSPSIWT